MKPKTTPKEVVVEAPVQTVVETPKLPTIEELMNASNLNEAQVSFKQVLEHYKIKNPKKFETKREAYVKKMIALGN